ncbi:M48 family metallopeptidase [Caldimonas tepidiphila]|uniref:M48 family metallopeptidase n=1 Tax=Caldimonas tepidiphila TaxID=2315841 RepID=UPI000E5A46B6|nr:M48 family metallopeptidase [Caldimonas tepidiphila]
MSEPRGASPAAPGAPVADYFDGRSARARRVALHVADGALHLRGEGVARAVPLGSVRWPERSRHGACVAHLDGGGSLHACEAAAWDAWADSIGQRDAWVVRAQQSWRALALAVLLLAGVAAAGYLWGLPWAARALVHAVPASVDAALGESAYRSLSARLLGPSRLPPGEQQRLREAFEAALRRAYPGGDAPPHRVLFHAGRIGPNAFALPGGTIVMTDELVKRVDGNAEVVVGVLAHELGHVEQRHGMRMLVQGALLAAAANLAFGDFSSWLAAAPVLLGQAGYSRDAEREADRAAIRILRAAGLSPLALGRFFEGMATERDASAGGLAIAFASHPADAERIRAFRDAARP